MRIDDTFRKTDFMNGEREPTLGAFKYAGKTPVLKWVDSGPKKVSFVELCLASLFAAILCLILILTPTGLTSEIVMEIARTVTISGLLRWIASVVVAMFAIFLLLKAASEYASLAKRRTKKFIDIDYEREYVKKIDLRMSALQKQVLDLQKENRGLHETGARHRGESSSTRQDVDNSTTDADIEGRLRDDAVASETNPLVLHIYNVIETLENHIDISDKKASNLLDTGTMYLRRGIYFYVVSILVWQGVAQFRGVDQALIFGIVSCSFTFLVVEFLAAWFLKQYRNFNDSSMQFMKVKSVYDRYLLSYHALIQFAPEQEEAVVEARAMMLAVLEKEARWPELSSLKTADVNHMAQIFESVGGILDKAKGVMSKERESS